MNYTHYQRIKIEPNSVKAHEEVERLVEHIKKYGNDPKVSEDTSGITIEWTNEFIRG